MVHYVSKEDAKQAGISPDLFDLIDVDGSGPCQTTTPPALSYIDGALLRVLRHFTRHPISALSKSVAELPLPFMLTCALQFDMTSPFFEQATSQRKSLTRSGQSNSKS